MMVAFFSFLFGALAYISPDLLVGRNSFLIGLCISQLLGSLGAGPTSALSFIPPFGNVST